MTKLEKAYKRYCKLRYYTILIIYCIKTIVELGFVQFAFKDFTLWSIAVVSVLAYFVARWSLLKNVKFRKRNFFRKKRR